MAIVIVAILGASLVNAAIAVAIVLLPHFVRITRASIVSESSRDYVHAARLDGAHGLRLFIFTLLPNIAAPLIVQSTLAFSSAILDIAALGFLGLGAQPPTPEWGTLLSSSRESATPFMNPAMNRCAPKKDLPISRCGGPRES